MNEEARSSDTLEQTGETVTTEPAPARKRPRRVAIVVGAVVAVLVVAGAGFWVWHEQPSFCNAICHTPMDGYLETYEAEPGQAAVDKWGNEVANASGMMAAVHRVEDGDTCMSCHVPTLGEQVSEAGAWISGDYTLVENEASPHGGVLIERGNADLTEARGVTADEFCLNEQCHDLTRAELTELTVPEPVVGGKARNVHSWQHGEDTCTDCHKAHRASVLTCSECHADMPIPEGWISVQEAKTLENQA